MTNSQMESNYSISNLTVAELEALITKIVQKVIREEIRNKKVEKEIVQSHEMPNNINYAQTPRPFGLWRGRVQMSDDFDVLPESIAAAFSGDSE
ncbi:hypothetical protein [Iningainema tapete]|uniref:Uncharacterized protein n=1 Tax=Iningainema tapete BLCC-T55 TaxID=2748662 RepID=A0A8J6XUX2_9CYAN|nr:hypothetical protein [Iningainema tapete]MBD2778810.1 hypothetical protein [Iningainema tapete BLCC-T55]